MIVVYVKLITKYKTTYYNKYFMIFVHKSKHKRDVFHNKKTISAKYLFENRMFLLGSGLKKRNDYKEYQVVS